MAFLATLKDIGKWAVEMEEVGEIFYRKLAAKAKDKKVKDICIFLANEEREHQKIFKSITSEAHVTNIQKSFNLDVITLMKNAVETMRNTGFQDDSLKVLNKELSVTECLKQALKAEKETTLLYQEIQGAIEGSRQVVLHRIIAEEERHAETLQNVLNILEKKSHSGPITKESQNEVETINVSQIDKKIIVEQKIIKKAVKRDNSRDILIVMGIALFFVLIILALVGPKLIQGLINAITASG